MTTENKNDTCANCKYFEPAKNECRAHPPFITGGRTMTLGVSSRFPYVDADDWCGEYQRVNGV